MEKLTDEVLANCWKLVEMGIQILIIDVMGEIKIYSCDHMDGKIHQAQFNSVRNAVDITAETIHFLFNISVRNRESFLTAIASKKKMSFMFGHDNFIWLQQSSDY